MERSASWSIKEVRPCLSYDQGVVKPGQLLAVMGTSGAGKSSLLNALARRTEKNVTGDILLNGQKLDVRPLC